MQKNNVFIKNLIGWAAVFFIALFSVEFAFSQCGTNFKTGYRKISNDTYNLRLEDWNNDGKLDFWKLRFNQATQTQDLVIFLNNGSNDWNWDSPSVSATTIPPGEYGSTGDNLLSVIDFEGDGDKDIFIAQARTFHAIHKNNGNGTFTSNPPQTFFDGQVLSSIGFVDVNSDGRLDWIQKANHPGVGNPISYRQANADGTFGPLVSIDTNVSTQNSLSVLGDFNGDGKIDIAYNNGSRYRVLTNNGNGSFTLGDFVVESISFGGVEDFNNDGRDDIVVQGSSGGQNPLGKIFVYFGQSNGTFSPVEYPIYNPSSGGSIIIGEFNGDNNPDFIESYNIPDYPAFYSVYINNGAGGFTRTDYTKSLGSGDLVFADLNSDNKTDIFIRSRDARYISNMFGEAMVVIQYNQCQRLGELKKVNFNHNSRTDLLMWNTATGDWLSKDADWNGPTSVKTFNWGVGSLDVPAPGDFDGDGATDYAVYRGGEGNWYIYLSSNSSWLVFRFGLNGDIPVPNDYDGGGKTDIAVFRPATGDWHIWSSETQSYTAFHFGASGDKPAPADYDGDSKTDAAVYRPSEGNWYYLRSSDNQFVAFRWGIASDKPVPADYDGDGKADLAVFRGSEGVWYIMRSSNNAAQSIQFGTSGDIAMPFYENGETAYPLVYRPSVRAWYSYYPGTPTNFGNGDYTPIYFGLPNN